jgi:lipoprotein NlpI
MTAQLILQPSYGQPASSAEQFCLCQQLWRREVSSHLFSPHQNCQFIFPTICEADYSLNIEVSSMKHAALMLMLFFGGATAMHAGEKPSAEDLIKQADEAFKKGDKDKGLELAGMAIAKEPKSVPAFLFRAAMFEALRKHKEAVADYDAALKLDAKLAAAYHRRGMEHFKLGHIKQSLTDFDRYLELVPDKDRPKIAAGHWQRGITCYYAGKFKEGQEQFESFQTIEDNDVENAVWRYLCMVPLVGAKGARKDLLKIKEDKRVPMKEIYDLFAGKIKPKDVLDAANEGKPKPQELNERLFYAHLYLGLYHQSEGDEKKALDHLKTAVTKHPIGHYMWDVARVHQDILLQKKKS